MILDDNTEVGLDMLTVKDIQKIFKLRNIATVYRWVDRGMIPYVRIGRNIRFNKDDIDKWLEDKRGDDK